MGEPALKIEWSEPELMAWRPREDINISEWSEKNRVLSSETSEERGPFRMRRVPYMAPIMDAALDPTIETICFMKPAQIAYTTCLENIVGYYSTEETTPIMFVLADEDTAQYISTRRLAQLFRESPNLEYYYKNGSFKTSEITLPNGSYIAMGWASSVAKLGSRPIRILLLDEIDKPGYYLTTKEADPISLARERTETFYNRKIFMGSTPTLDTGNIAVEMDGCDVVYDWHVPCPACGVFQPLRWSSEHAAGFDDGQYRGGDGEYHPLGHVKWEGGRDATPEQIEAAGYECGSCGALWSTVEKNLAVERGKMVARDPIEHRPTKVGFHINRIYSLLGKSGDISKLVADFLACKRAGDPKRMQGFVNSTLAEPWTQAVLKTTEAEILRARVDLKPQTVPVDAIALTAGIDPQKYGFWFTVRAWAKDFRSWLIHYGFLTSWEEVESLLFATEYPRADGKGHPLRIWRAGIDTGGTQFDNDPSMTQQAYAFARENGSGRGCQVRACKGSSRPLTRKVSNPTVLDSYPSGKPIPGGLALYRIDTDSVKDQFFYRLNQAQEAGPHSAFLHKKVGVDYARQILAEEKRLNEKGVQEWVRIRPDNHLLDCECLAMIVADPEWPGGGINVLAEHVRRTVAKQQATIERKKKKQEPRSFYERPGWLNDR